MPDPAERFLAAATAPLGDNAELQVMARRELGECLVDGEAEALAEAASALEKGKPRRGWKTGLYSVTAVVSIITLGLLAKVPGLVDAATSSGLGGALDGQSPEKIRGRLGKGLNSEQRLLLFGDTSQADPGNQFKPLWDSAPENPAYFARFALDYIGIHDRLPPDFLETADRLDPDNAWFTMVALGVTAKDAVKRERRTPEETKQEIPARYSIIDQARLDEAVKLLGKAAAQPRLNSYQAELLAEQIAIVPPRTDFASQMPLLVHVAGAPTDSGPLTSAVMAVDAAAWQAADRGDATAFLQIANQWQPILRNLAEAESPTFLNGLIIRAAIAATANRYGKTTLPELEELNQRWKPVSERMRAEKEDRDRRGWNDELKLKGGMFAALSLPVVTKWLQSPIPITDADLKPGRMVEHELFSRVSASVRWLVLGLMLLTAAVYRQRAGLLVRRLSARLEDLLKPIDWAWILGAGVVLPFLFYLAIYRLTPFGARDWSIAASAFLVPSGQVAAMGFLMIVLPVLVARWRLGRRGAMLGWRKSHPWLGWTAVICGALSLPLFGLSFANGKGSETVMMIAAGLLGVLVLTGLILGLRAVFSKRPALLRRMTLSRTLIPAYALGMLLMAASMPFYHAAEKRWLAQDRLMEITPEAPALSRYEWEVAQAMRAELLEVLEAR
jgi:hypothetical protein